MRAGWGDEADPRIQCENVVSRYRDRRAQKPVLLAGSAAHVDHNSRVSAKVPFEIDTVVNMDAMVRVDEASLQVLQPPRPRCVN